MYKLEILPYDLIFYIKDLLDPISFVSFLEIGSYLLNPIQTYYEDRQYKNKQIEYFQTRGIIVTNETKFLTLSDKTITNYKLTEPGNYILIGKSSHPIKFLIDGNDIHLNFNKKTIKYPQSTKLESNYANLNIGVKMTGKNISIVNGTIVGYDMTLIFGGCIYDFMISNMDLTLYCSYPNTFYGICILISTNGLIANCKIGCYTNDSNVLSTKQTVKITAKRDITSQNIKKNIEYKKNKFYTEQNKNKNKNNINYQKIDRRPNNRYKSWKR